MCGKLSMERTNQYREHVRRLFPSGTELKVSIGWNSGKTFSVTINAPQGHCEDIWSRAVNRSGYYGRLRFRTPKDGTDLLEFACKKINDTVWDKKNPGRYVFKKIEFGS